MTVVGQIGGNTSAYVSGANATTAAVPVAKAGKPAPLMFGSDNTTPPAQEPADDRNIFQKLMDGFLGLPGIKQIYEYFTKESSPDAPAQTPQAGGPDERNTFQKCLDGFLSLPGIKQVYEWLFRPEPEAPAGLSKPVAPPSESKAEAVAPPEKTAEKPAPPATGVAIVSGNDGTGAETVTATLPPDGTAATVQTITPPPIAGHAKAGTTEIATPPPGAVTVTNTPIVVPPAEDKKADPPPAEPTVPGPEPSKN